MLSAFLCENLCVLCGKNPRLRFGGGTNGKELADITPMDATLRLPPT
ncbi:MAG: hypothetical protein ABIR24_08085 [Verrucomicrobiota bacterium]